MASVNFTLLQGEVDPQSMKATSENGLEKERLNVTCAAITLFFFVHGSSWINWEIFFFFFFSFPSEFPCLFLSCYSGLAPLEHLSSWPTSFLLNLLSPSPCVPAASFSFTFIFLVIASLYIFIAFIPITPSLPLLVTPLDQWAPHVSRT